MQKRTKNTCFFGPCFLAVFAFFTFVVLDGVHQEWVVDGFDGSLTTYFRGSKNDLKWPILGVFYGLKVTKSGTLFFTFYRSKYAKKGVKNHWCFLSKSGSSLTFRRSYFDHFWVVDRGKTGVSGYTVLEKNSNLVVPPKWVISGYPYSLMAQRGCPKKWELDQKGWSGGGLFWVFPALLSLKKVWEPVKKGQNDPFWGSQNPFVAL